MGAFGLHPILSEDCAGAAASYGEDFTYDSKLNRRWWSGLFPPFWFFFCEPVSVTGSWEELVYLAAELSPLSFRAIRFFANTQMQKLFMARHHWLSWGLRVMVLEMYFLYWIGWECQTPLDGFEALVLAAFKSVWNEVIENIGMRENRWIEKECGGKIEEWKTKNFIRVSVWNGGMR
jgi:hypothetical protein